MKLDYINDEKLDTKRGPWTLHPLLQILQSQVKLEEEKQIALKVKTNMNVNDKKHEISSEDLAAKVLATYLRCGMDADPSLTTLQMLTMIEVSYACINLLTF